MKYDRFQGDPAIRITENGASMSFKGGQPVMDMGIDNAAQISLFTDPGWWGNALVTEESQKIGSDFDMIRTIIDVQTINDITDAARLALLWMTQTRLAGSVDVAVTNPSGGQIRTAVTITPPTGDAQQLLFFKNGVNWIYQSLFPAHERMT